MTWLYGVLRDRTEMCIKGRVNYYIRRYLEPQSFRVRSTVEYSLNSSYIQEIAVSQGGILLISLFAMKISALPGCMPNDNRLWHRYMLSTCKYRTDIVTLQ